MCINHTQKHYQYQRQDLSHCEVAIQHFLSKHFIAICAILGGVCTHMCKQPIKSILNPHYTFEREGCSDYEGYCKKS